ncbi:LLM class flavin-dependent oxidoreductase [Pseudactinotalea suaedae]
MTGYVALARDLGFEAVAANDHLVYRYPWLDSIVALSSVLEAAEGMTLATTVALPVVRGPEVLASAALALDALSGGRLLLGVGAGSSRADYEATGHDFELRWPLFWDAVDQLHASLPGGPPIWVGSWGSSAVLRRTAARADGWLASAAHTTPAVVAARCAEHGLQAGVATMWTAVTDDADESRRRLAWLSEITGVPAGTLAERVLVGSPSSCARLVRAYQDAGVHTLFLWPLGDPERGLERVARDVLPMLSDPP